MPDTKDVKRLTGIADYWHFIRYPTVAGWRLVFPFIERHWTTEIEPPYRHGLGSAVRVFGPFGIAFGRWVTEEEQAILLIHRTRGAPEERTVSRFRRWQMDRTVRKRRLVRKTAVVMDDDLSAVLTSDEVPLEHL